MTLAAQDLELKKKREAYTSTLKVFRPELFFFYNQFQLTLLHSEWQKLYGVLALQGATGLNIR